MTNGKIYGNWTQPSGVEIFEIDFDGDAHAFAIDYKGWNVTTIYAWSPDHSDAIRSSLNASNDVREWYDGNGNCVGSLLDETIAEIEEWLN